MGSLTIRAADGTNVLAIGLSDDEVLAIDLCDPYADTAWSGERLVELRRAYEERARQLRDEATRSVCAKLHRDTVEEWMLPVIERACAVDRRIATAQRVADAAREALRVNGTLVFEGD